MNLHLDVAQVSAAIDALLASYPELQDDETLRADMLDGCTDIAAIFVRIDQDIEATGGTRAIIKSEVDERKGRDARLERREEALRKLAQALMERANLSKFTLPNGRTFSITHRKPSPIIVDETKLPAECTKTVTQPDKTVIKQWCAAGNIPDGVVMSNGSSSLSIRTT